MTKQANCALKIVLIDYTILETIGNFIPTMVGKAAARNAAGETAKTVVDAS